MKLHTRFFAIILVLMSFLQAKAETGYDLWLRYVPVTDEAIRTSYLQKIGEVAVYGNSETARVIREELATALSGMLDQDVTIHSQKVPACGLVVYTSAKNAVFDEPGLKPALEKLGDEGFLIVDSKTNNKLIIASKTGIGALYGTFHFLRLLQTNQPIDGMRVEEKPKTTHRL
ncbi:MAG: hypothetical protein K9H26_03025, partial [Prolixibacteraceae bacterium]|nr:hypothetical protein [Prolixibacteraceae bacterium]